MFQDDLKNHIDEVKNEFEDYVDKRISLLKLHLVEELSRFTAGFAVKLGILYLLFFVFMFLSLAAAFFLATCWALTDWALLWWPVFIC